MDLLVTTSQSMEESQTTIRAGLAGAGAARDISEKESQKAHVIVIETRSKF
jgi:hypothetical protein